MDQRISLFVSTSRKKKEMTSCCCYPICQGPPGPSALIGNALSTDLVGVTINNGDSVNNLPGLLAVSTKVSVNWVVGVTLSVSAVADVTLTTPILGNLVVNLFRNGTSITQVTQGVVLSGTVTTYDILSFKYEDCVLVAGSPTQETIAYTI